MYLSNYLIPVLKENPADAVIASHRYMLRGGFVKQMHAGIYSWLPLGLRVLKNIESLLRDTLNDIGCQEILMPILQSADLWQETDRYEAYGPELMRLQDRHKRDMLLGPTNEEMVTDIFRSTIQSYKALPKTLYHIQWKFRDEVRPRFGVMRGREFLMKDAYSFDMTEKKARDTYEKMMFAYLSFFKKLGLNAIPIQADAGPIGGDLSHEFHILAPTGESDIYYDSRLHTLSQNMSFHDITQYYAVEEETYKQEDFHHAVPETYRTVGKGIEVGHIFYLGTKYSSKMKAHIVDQDNKETPVYMGCYGIGISRLVGALIEASHDDKGIIWHKDIAPFQIGLINLHPKNTDVNEKCEAIYQGLTQKGISVLYDDTPMRAGAKFSTMDLIGLPYQVILGSKSLETRKVEIKNRQTGEKEEISFENIDNYLSHLMT